MRPDPAAAAHGTQLVDDATPGPDDGAGGLRVRRDRRGGQAGDAAAHRPAVPTSGTVRYVLAMTEGDVTITLDRAKAPCTVNSFVSLAGQGYFDTDPLPPAGRLGIFILQCGDPTGTGQGGPGYQFANETDGTESYTRGVVAMANAGPEHQRLAVLPGLGRLDQPGPGTQLHDLRHAWTPASRDVVAAMAAEGQDGSNPDGTGRPNNPSEIIRRDPGLTVSGDMSRASSTGNSR